MQLHTHRDTFIVLEIINIVHNNNSGSKLIYSNHIYTLSFSCLANILAIPVSHSILSQYTLTIQMLSQCMLGIWMFSQHMLAIWMLSQHMLAIQMLSQYNLAIQWLSQHMLVIQMLSQHMLAIQMLKANTI